MQRRSAATQGLFWGGNHLVEVGQGFHLVFFGAGAVMAVESSMADWCRTHLLPADAKALFDGPRAFALEKELRAHGLMLRGTAVHSLRKSAPALMKPDGVTFTWLAREEAAAFPDAASFDHALNGDGTDALAILCRQGDMTVAVAAADDCWAPLYQIGVDVLAEARGQGLAAWMVAALAEEITRRGHIPFYTTWPGNLPSTRTALRAGFQPAWLSMTAVPTD